MYSEDNSEYGDDRNSDHLQWSRISVQMVVVLDVSAKILAAQPERGTHSFTPYLCRQPPYCGVSVSDSSWSVLLCLPHSGHPWRLM